MAAGSVIGGVPIAVWRSSMLRQITALLVPRDSGLLDRGHKSRRRGHQRREQSVKHRLQKQWIRPARSWKGGTLATRSYLLLFAIVSLAAELTLLAPRV